MSIRKQTKASNRKEEIIMSRRDHRDERRALDMINRDPNEMNTYIQIEFDDILAEPHGAYSADCVWRNSYACFSCGFNCCYRFQTVSSLVCSVQLEATIIILIIIQLSIYVDAVWRYSGAVTSPSWLSMQFGV